MAHKNLRGTNPTWVRHWTIFASASPPLPRHESMPPPPPPPVKHFTPSCSRVCSSREAPCLNASDSNPLLLQPLLLVVTALSASSTTLQLLLLLLQSVVAVVVEVVVVVVEKEGWELQSLVQRPKVREGERAEVLVRRRERALNAKEGGG